MRLMASFLISVIFLFSVKVYAMSIFDAGKVCTFSAISGVILKDGEPVSGATVIRTTDYQKEKTDKTETDEKGYFEFPARFERHIVNFLPQEFVVGQSIVVIDGGQEYKIWGGAKRKREENSESRGKPLVVTCELNSDKTVIEVDRQPFITRCKWDVEPDIVDKGL